MARIEFSHALPCGLDAAALFEWLIEALRDTDRIEIWPRHLNRVRIEKFKVGHRFEAEYRLPFRSSKSPYVLVDYAPGRGFAYAPAEGHPFTGRVEVRVEEAPEGSILHWFGAYEAPLWRPERAFFKLYFEPRFFAALRESLARLKEAEDI